MNGIAGRVNRRHKNVVHRASLSGSYLYSLIDHPEVDAHYVTLAEHSDSVETPLVILTEAVMTCVFWAYDNESYRECRPGGLPVVDRKHGVNRSDPLFYRSFIFLMILSLIYNFVVQASVLCKSESQHC